VNVLARDAHGLQVHSGMWNALHSQKQPIKTVISKVKEILRTQKGVQDVILCGHSLGGGYAILTALAMLKQEVKVTAVLTFGAPQVVVPDRSVNLWNALNAITTLFVNSYDVIPRLPSGLPDGFKMQGPLFAAVKWNLECGEKCVKNFQGIVQKLSGHDCQVVAKYDTIGTLVFITEGTRRVMKVASAADKSHREMLNSLPDDARGFLMQQHSMDAYVLIVKYICGDGQ
jgi:pimeloyl-ACP methyl ester carboxylesterase